MQNSSRRHSSAVAVAADAADAAAAAAALYLHSYTFDCRCVCMYVCGLYPSTNTNAASSKYVFLCGVAFEYILVSNRTIAVAVISHTRTYRQRENHFPLRLFSSEASEYVDTANKESCIHNRAIRTGENQNFRKSHKIARKARETGMKTVFTWLLCLHKI